MITTLMKITNLTQGVINGAEATEYICSDVFNIKANICLDIFNYLHQSRYMLRFILTMCIKAGICSDVQYLTSKQISA